MKLLGIGCDVEDADRFPPLLEKPAFLQRFFTAGEQRELAQAQDPPRRLGEMFCIKEAVIKALWQEIQVPLKNIEVTGTGAQLEVGLDRHPRSAEITIRVATELREASYTAWVSCWRTDACLTLIFNRLSCATASIDPTWLSVYRQALPTFGQRGPIPGTFLKHRSPVFPPAAIKRESSRKLQIQTNPRSMSV